MPAHPSYVASLIDSSLSYAAQNTIDSAVLRLSGLSQSFEQTTRIY